MPPEGIPPRREGFKCVLCFTAQQVIDSGVVDDHPDVLALVQEAAFDADAVVVVNGKSMCEKHLNLGRGWPAGFPSEPMPKPMVAKLVGRYEEMLD